MHNVKRLLRTPTLLFFALALFCAVTARAGALIEARDGDGRFYRIHIAANWARVQTLGTAEYLLLGLARPNIYAVDPATRQAVDLSAMVGGADTAAGPAPRLEAAGPGPKIAGWATRRYEMRAAGRRCGSYFFAPASLRSKDVKNFLVAMARFAATKRQQNAAAASCEHAVDVAESAYPQLGLALRVLDDKGKVSYQILKLDVNADIPPAATRLPADFAVVQPEALR
ncbi:MAG TPA: hypothetical protein ENJ19_00900 [Gammaproteobacteria bacterium]|nr:hypothetical protein [Gammaproteobacteria bacterium]